MSSPPIFDRKRLALAVHMAYNAGRQLLPEAGATQEQTLEAVSCTP
jgi:hypothetical protein